MLSGSLLVLNVCMCHFMLFAVHAACGPPGLLQAFTKGFRTAAVKRFCDFSLRLQQPPTPAEWNISTPICGDALEEGMSQFAPPKIWQLQFFGSVVSAIPI